MTGVCNRTLHNLIDHLACSMSDLEGTELKRIADKNGTYDPDADGIPDGVDFFTLDDGEGELNHIRWSEAFLTSVINDGFRILHLERPDLFNGPVKVQLKPCTDRQELPDGCMKFGGNIYTEGCGCEPGTRATQVSNNQIRSSNALLGGSCTSKSGGEYAVSNFSFDPDSPGSFYVSPVPPEGQESCVIIDCVGAPPCYDWDEDANEIVGDGFSNMLDIYEPFIIEYALHRAFQSDRESESSSQRSKDHWEKALKIIAEGKISDFMFYRPDLYLVGSFQEGSSVGQVQQ